MNPIEFKEQTTVLAKNQPEYKPLPVHIGTNQEGIPFTSCWKLSWKERIKLLFTGKLWIQQLTFYHPFQPVLPSTENPIK